MGMARQLAALGARRSAPGLPLATVLLAILSFPGCADEAPGLDGNALQAFRVQIITASSLGPPPYLFPTEFVPITLSIEALRQGGGVKEDFNTPVMVRVVPGQLDPATAVAQLANGVNASHEVRVRYTFGTAYIWVEDVGLDRTNECRDGFDNDGDGHLDFPGDSGCTSPEDPSEGSATYATGVSQPLEFQPISIRNVQFNPDDLDGVSPILGEEVRVEQGRLLVTNVVSTGFYLTDVDEAEGYGSIFIFNFSFPDGVQLGDKIAWVSGGVAEFQQGTQLTFPSWEHDAGYDLDDSVRLAFSTCQPVTDPSVLQAPPTLLTTADLGNHETLERVESGVVRIENAQVSETFVLCDFDRSGDIIGAAEVACRSECQIDNLCTELSNFEEFDQFNVDVGGASAQVAGARRVANFDATEGCTEVASDPFTLSCPPRRLVSATGNLRHVFLTNSVQLYELIPRFACDLVFSCAGPGDCPPDSACVNSVCEYD